ncbi:hypothetical protein [Promicromonospora soli]
MAKVDWLVIGLRSNQVMITAPGAPGTAAQAVHELDAALLDPEEQMPGWFTAVQRTGYWWYLICMVIAVPIALVVIPTEIVGRIIGGLTGGLALAGVSSAVLTLLARIQARRATPRSHFSDVERLSTVVRVAPAGAQKVFDAVVERDARLEPEVHELLWRGAGHGSDREAAKADLDALLQRVAPDFAAQGAVDDEELAGRLEEVRRLNGL